MSKVATFVKQAENMKGQAEVYDVDPPIKDWDGEEYDTVVISSICGVYATECFIFPWDKEEDTISDWGELNGSKKGVVTPSELLRELGYEIKED